jgi:hypothetical protein
MPVNRLFTMFRNLIPEVLISEYFYVKELV